MPAFDTPTQEKIDALRVRYRAGETIEPFELLAIEWPEPDGTIYYSVMQTDEIADPPPPVSPIETRLIPDGNPDWFLPITADSSIGDEELDVEMWDADEVISQLLVDHGEGIKCIPYYWFPQEELLLPFWHGHLRFEDEAAVDKIKLKIVQGFRSVDANVPGRAHYQQCAAVFGGLFDTDEEAAEYGPDCPYNKNRGGVIGTNDPATGLPWTFCTRETTQSCIDRGVNPLFHLSHRTIQVTTTNPQSHGPNLLVMSQGNETNLKDPVRVAMGTRRIHSMPVIAFLRVPNTGHPDQAWFYGIYEGPEGPIASFSDGRVTVNSKTQIVAGNNLQHYQYRLGTRGQTAPAPDITTHGFSGTSFIRYNFGWVNPLTVDENQAVASFVVDGLDDIRIYSDEDTYITASTSNRAWQIARTMCDKRWGYGYDYARLNILGFIDAAEWCAQTVQFVDPFGTQWDHVRADSHPELIGKKVQQQIEDLCMAGRLSRPFLFDGKINVMPLRQLTQDELAACPVFTDEGDDGRNIIWEDDKSSLTVSRKSDLDLINRVECTIHYEENDWLQTPLSPVGDIDQQLPAGPVVRDKSRKINSKKYALLGVTTRNQAMKMAWSILDLGEFDEGGLQNNLSLKFKTWFMDTLDLHQEKVIKVVSSRLTKYKQPGTTTPFTYFRVKKMKRLGNLQVEMELQAYNETYMAAFEHDFGVGAGPSMIASGFCESICNGEWIHGGIYNGRPWFQKGSLFCESVFNPDVGYFQYRMWSAGGLIIYYVCDSEVDNPWEDTWSAVSGCEPAGTVTEGDISDAPEPDLEPFCDIDHPCPEGFECVDGVCVALDPEDPDVVLKITPLFDHWTDEPTTGTGEETLYIDQIDAGTLAVNGDKITAEYSGIKTSTSNHLRMWFDGERVFDSDDYPLDLPGGDQHWQITITAIRVSNTVLRFAATFSVTDAADNKNGMPWVKYYEMVGRDLAANDYDLELRAETSGAGQITAKMGHGMFIPAATTNTDWLLDENGMPILDENFDQIEAG